MPSLLGRQQTPSYETPGKSITHRLVLLSYSIDASFSMFRPVTTKGRHQRCS